MLSIIFPSDTLIVFAYAQAGLGHIRVADALYDGLPAGAHALMLRSREKSVTSLHRLTSIHPILRRLMEFMQNGWPEEQFTRVYRRMLVGGRIFVEEELARIVNQEQHPPKTILIIATHFGLAHQFAAIKSDFAKKYSMRVVVVVVVTDDSPQKMWAVPGADLIFCPSSTTKRALVAYHQTIDPSGITRYIASPYMILPSFAVTLARNQYKQRMSACDARSSVPIILSIPVSGAAVQLEFLLEVINGLSQSSPRFHFEVTSKQSMFTAQFLRDITEVPEVTSHTSPWDRNVIEQYESLYKEKVITAEITKPSEQAFKALLCPRHVGGALMLFSEPVGRQERDNLAFFARHDLIPSLEEQALLFELAEKRTELSASPYRTLLVKAKHWRGLRLPTKPQEAVAFINWTRSVGIWSEMATFSSFPEDPGLHSDGVARFWKYVADYLQ